MGDVHVVAQRAGVRARSVFLPVAQSAHHQSVDLLPLGLALDRILPYDELLQLLQRRNRMRGEFSAVTID
jgi:hypothetical protein